MLSKGTPLLRSRRVLYIFLGLYAATLILLIPGKPLWMDEIIDLNGVRNVSDVSGVLAFVPGNAGGVPLGYLVDFWMIRAFGYSEFIVRLPSLLFTVLTCAGVYILARQTRFRMPLMAVILYAVSPLNLRYALEARPYAQAACWSVFSTVVFLSLIRQPTFGKAAGYAGLVAADLFTQPYSIFVPVAHLIWLLFTSSVKEKPRAIMLAGTAVALASLSFLPWYFKAHAAWQGAVSGGARFLVTGKDLLVMPHELMGTGYAGAALAGIAIPMALLAAMLYEDAHWILRPGGGWQAAAAQLKEEDCPVFVPSGAQTMYLFFEPQLRACDENTLAAAGSVALALSPDQPASMAADARQKLNRAGFRKVADLRIADPRIELYRRGAY